MKKKLAVICSLLGVVALAACGKETVDEPQKVEAEKENASEEKYEETVTLSLLVDQNWLDSYGTALEALSDAALEKYNIQIELENKTNGSDGDNIVKTRLAAGEMTDLLIFNSGAQFTALNPSEYFVDLTECEFMDTVDETFKQSVTVDGKVYGIPVSSSNVGGIIYNKKIYEELELEIPLTWDSFMENMEKCKEAGYNAMLGTCADAWSAQYIFLADNYNILAEEPDFPQKFEENQIKFASSEIALRSWEKLADAGEYLNEDYMANTVMDGMDLLAGEDGPVHYAGTSQMFAYIAASASKDKADEYGIFPIPGDNEENNGFTVWMPNGLYINKDSENAEAAMKFVEFYASAEGMDIFKENAAADGPYLIEGVELPEDSYQGVLDIQSYFDEGRTALALEFQTALKGATCDQICVECISGSMTPEKAAQVYDEDCEKMAQQLGLEGWN